MEISLGSTALGRMWSVRTGQDRGTALGLTPAHPTPASACRELQLQRAMQRRREQGYSKHKTLQYHAFHSQGKQNVPDVRVYKGKQAIGGLKAGDRHLVDDVNCPVHILLLPCLFSVSWMTRGFLLQYT